MQPNRKHIWNQVPLFRVLWPLIAGIILGIFRPSIFLAFVLLGVAVIIAIVLFVRKDHGLLFAFGTIPLIAMLGYIITTLNTERLFDSHYSHHLSKDESILVGKITSDPIPRAKSVKAEMEVMYLVSNGDTTKVSGTILTYVQLDSSSRKLAYADKIVVRGRLAEIPEPRNPGEFNYKRYLHFHQISHQLYTPTGSWFLASTGDGLIRTIQSWQHRVIDIMAEFGLNDRELAIVSALIVGYKHYLSSDQVNAFASAGAMHVLAVSGLHVGIVFLVINLVLKPMEFSRKGRMLRALIMLIALWSYAALTGMSPSVARAAAMFTFVLAAQQFNRHTDIFNTLATSATFLLVLNPFLIVEVGFQLSYLAVLGIVVLQPSLYQLWETKWWLMDKIWGITTVSIAAQVATFPLGLLYFHQFPNYFLIANLVVIPAATAILPVGIALVAFSWVPVLNGILGWALFWLVHGLDRFIVWVDSLPGALVLGIDISIFETYFIYMIIITSIVFLIHKSYQWLFAFLLTMCIVEIFNIYESVEQKHQREIVFYSVKDHVAIDYISGHDHVFVTDTALQQDFDKMRFHIHHHWWQLDLNEPITEIRGLKQSNWLTQFFGYRIISPRDSFYIPALPDSVDVLYVTERTLQHPNELLENTKPKLVLLGNRLTWRDRNYWIRLLDDQRISTWNMREQGAFVYKSD